MEEEKPKPTSRRAFVKAAIIGGASAAVVGTAVLAPNLRPTAAPAPVPSPGPSPFPQAGSYLVWFDKAAALFRRRNLATGTDEFSQADGAVVVQSAIDALPSDIGGTIWITEDLDAPNGIVMINKDSVSLVSLRDPPPRYRNTPRPHIQKIQYTGVVRGGLLQGLHCRELQFDGTGNQQMMVLRDISMHPTGQPNQQGLRFLGSAGYMQYIEIQNLKVALSGTGADYSAIEFGNTNSGFGHITFSGNTSIETEYDAAGSPVAIKVSSGAETGTPIRFENLSVVEQSARTSGIGLRPILMQAQSEPSKGLRQMNIDRFFFEQHYTSPHTIVTIEPASGAGACWFVLTIDELAISDEIGKTVNLLDNRNTSWMSREQVLRVNGGYKDGVGTMALGNLNPNQFFRVYLGNMSGVTPFGKLATPFFESTPMSFVGAGGTNSAPTTGEYVVVTTPVVVASTDPWSLKDSAGNLIETVPATQARTVPLGYRVQFPTGTPSIFA